MVSSDNLQLNKGAITMTQILIYTVLVLTALLGVSIKVALNLRAKKLSYKHKYQSEQEITKDNDKEIMQLESVISTYEDFHDNLHEVITRTEQERDSYKKQRDIFMHALNKVDPEGLHTRHTTDEEGKRIYFEAVNSEVINNAIDESDRSAINA